MSSPYLPAELLDRIVDHLHDTKDALKSCGLVSPSWIPRTRTHLFADIMFDSPYRLQSWKTTFPDPPSSPAGYARYLFIRLPLIVTAADAEVDGWISAFSNVVRFEVDIRLTPGTDLSTISLVSFYGFSPITKNFRVSLSAVPSSQVFDLISSFPLLEDLSVNNHSRDRWIGSDGDFVWPQDVAKPSKPPLFTGTLELSFETGMDPVASWLLSAPGGLHFRELHLEWKCEEDVPSTTALIEKCSSTLESLTIGWGFLAESLTISTDLSKATNIKDVLFVCNLDPQWVSMALQTITHSHKNLGRISVHPEWVLYKLKAFHVDIDDVRSAIGEATYMKWLELDRVLSEFWELRSIRPRVMYNIPFWRGGEWARARMEVLLPEITARGIVDFVGSE